MNLRGLYDPTKPIGYIGAHQRVHTVRGKAHEHKCFRCGAPAEEWAYQHNAPHEFSGIRKSKYGIDREIRWSGDPADYEPMCKPCHAEFDAEAKYAVRSGPVIVTHMGNIASTG